MEVGFVGDFAKSFVLASGSIVAGYCIRSGVEYYRMRKFRRAFGQGVKKPDDLMISVPLWRALEGDRSAARFLKADSFGTREEYYGPGEMYNVDDMGAAAFLLNVIGNHFSEPVAYTNDAARADWNARTVLVIGSPAANYHARYYMRKYLEARNGLQIPHFVDIVEDNVTGARAAVKVPGREDLMMSSEQKDYGLILRIPNIFSPDGRFFVFLIAGIHAASTREAARLLKELWSESFPAKGVAAFVFEMEANMEGTGRIVHRSRGTVG